MSVPKSTKKVQAFYPFGFRVAPDLLFSRAAAALLSFEATFVLFLFAGRYKADPRFAWIPVDLTLLFFLISLGVGVYVLIRRRFHVSRAAFLVSLTYILFLWWLLTTLTWSPSSGYGVDKARQLMTLNAWALLGSALIIADKAERFERFALLILILSAWITLEAMILYVRSRGGFLYVLGSTYLGTGRVVGLAACVAIIYAINKPGLAMKLVSFLLLGLFVFVLLTAGGRGPLLATVMACVTPVLATFRFSGTVLRVQKKTLMLVAVLVLGFGAALLLAGEKAQTVSRVLVSVEQSAGGRSIATRLNYYDAALEQGSTAPLFGHGLGAWPLLIGHSDTRDYPHNIFAELMVEEGLIGVALFLLTLAAGFYSGILRRARSEPLCMLAVIIWVNAFVNAQFTGDLLDNRVLFCATGLLVYRGKRVDIR